MFHLLLAWFIVWGSPQFVFWFMVSFGATYLFFKFLENYKPTRSDVRTFWALLSAIPALVIIGALTFVIGDATESAFVTLATLGISLAIYTWFLVWLFRDSSKPDAIDQEGKINLDSETD